MANQNNPESSTGTSSSGRQQSQQGQQIERSQQGGGLSQSTRTQQSYFPSPLEFIANPFSAMRRMHEDMDRVFAQALGGGMMSAGSGTSTGAGLAAWAPTIEVKQKDNELTVCADLPGLKPDEVQVEVNEDALVIQGERRQEQTREEEGGIRRTERQYGRFYRAVPLPEGVNAEQAKAQFRDGVLEVTIPLPEQQSRRRQIPISGAGTGSASQKTGQASTSKGPERPSSGD